MVDQGAWSEEYEQKVVADADAQINAAVVEMEKELIPTLDEVFDHTYEKLTPDLAKQKAAAIKRFEGK